MNNLEKLMADHAYWSAERKRLKQEGADEYEKCKRLDNIDKFFANNGKTCLQLAYSEWQVMHDENPFDSYSYDEVLDEVEACEHCRRVRKLKSERAIAGQRLGAVRSAITRIGNRLLKEGSIDEPF